MADKKESEGVIEFRFPAGGLNESLTYADQTILTTPVMVNCRIRDSAENRIRGGQKDGRSKVFEEQAGDDRPILKMIMITNTYVQPES